jgi:t-SNARE complex subunit (syntaxin)
MFVDLSVLVEYQGELLNNIGTHVNAATENITYGNEEITVAVDTTKKMRYLHA